MATKSKTLSLEVPDYLTVRQYSKMALVDNDSKLNQMASIISALTHRDIEEVLTWSLDSMTKVYKVYAELADTKNEFHSLIEWNGQLYGYSHINSMSLGCYVDLENLSKEMHKNLHKVAAILYRPVTKHRFNTLDFMVKQKVKMVNNDVENVFDWYEIEEYTSQKRKEVEESFKEFPAHVLLGAIAFFLSTANLYLSSTVFSQETKEKVLKEKIESLTMENLFQNIGAGGGLFTTSLNPIYYRLQETPQ